MFLNNKGHTLPFPVQIAGPNHFVYMTIYIPSQEKYICLILPSDPGIFEPHHIVFD